MVSPGSYRAAHKHLDRNYEKVACEECGATENLDWAYKGERGGWSFNREDYRVLCRTCHSNESDTCPQGHAFTPENTRTTKGGSRMCRECERERCRRYHRENRDRELARMKRYKRGLRN